jgi:hypothetical protein
VWPASLATAGTTVHQSRFASLESEGNLVNLCPTLFRCIRFEEPRYRAYHSVHPLSSRSPPGYSALPTSSKHTKDLATHSNVGYRGGRGDSSHHIGLPWGSRVAEARQGKASQVPTSTTRVRGEAITRFAIVRRAANRLSICAGHEGIWRSDSHW